MRPLFVVLLAAGVLTHPIAAKDNSPWITVVHTGTP